MLLTSGCSTLIIAIKKEVVIYPFITYLRWCYFEKEL
nr:MAG TPA: hypothetical protein [Caudoviricetes sp.]